MHSELIQKIDSALERMLLNRSIDSGELAVEEELLQSADPLEAEIWSKMLKLQHMHNELQRFSVELSKGELATSPPPRSNYLASGLKQLQMHLRHLTWQTQCISEGDYNQKVDFMGEFSEAFNKMVVQMRDREHNILTQREMMLRVFDQIEPVFIVAEEDPTLVRYANRMAKLRFHLDMEGDRKRKLLDRFRETCPPNTRHQLQDSDSGRWYSVTCEEFFWDL